MRIPVLLAAGILVAALSACSSPESDFKTAEQANTEASYQKFLGDHPEGPLADEARKRITDLHDERDWLTAQQADSADALRAYLQAYPSGLHAPEAESRLGEVERRAAWQAADAAGSKEALEAFMAQYPGTPEATEAEQRLAALAPPPPPPAPPKGKAGAKSPATATAKAAAAKAAPAAKAPAGRYRAQLGAFSSKSVAEQERASLGARYGSVVPGPLVVVAPAGGSDKLWRVRSAGTSEAEATRACKSLKAKGQPCLVVPP